MTVHPAAAREIVADLPITDDAPVTMAMRDEEPVDMLLLAVVVYSASRKGRKPKDNIGSRS